MQLRLTKMYLPLMLLIAASLQRCAGRSSLAASSNQLPVCRLSTQAAASASGSSATVSGCDSGSGSSRTGSSTSTISVSSGRSEEHTSELQSREKLVCRLLLENKNQQLLY